MTEYSTASGIMEIHGHDGVTGEQLWSFGSRSEHSRVQPEMSTGTGVGSTVIVRVTEGPLDSDEEWRHAYVGLDAVTGEVLWEKNLGVSQFVGLVGHSSEVALAESGADQ